MSEIIYIQPSFAYRCMHAYIYTLTYYNFLTIDGNGVKYKAKREPS